jgi:hypothetical protein
VARNNALSFRDAVGEVRDSDIESRHARMQPLERARIVTCGDLFRRRVVVPPERDGEPVPLIGTRLDSGIETRRGALVLSEALRNLDFGVEGLLPRVRNSGKDVAWQ